ncbi:ArsR/SmtB family transcription factor [Marinospirillum sp.]|uniref:ArsR/SmtB family transcription factor n=1 Tax=Marinospirillum sp. TaxID=2183934 RepID=UPI00384C1722
MPTPRSQLFETLAQVGRALGNGHRLELLERLAQAEASVEVLATAAELSIANASQHLQHLRRAGLVTARREGRQMIYRLTDERIVQLLNLLRDVAQSNLAEVERLVGRLFTPADEDQPLEAKSTQELWADLQAGRVQLLDVRSEDEFQAGHLPSALNLPADQLDQLLDRLPRDQPLVAYCRGPYCVLSHQVVERLRSLGFQVTRYEEGYPEWKAAGLPVD